MQANNDIRSNGSTIQGREIHGELGNKFHLPDFANISMANETSASDLVAEVRKLRRLQLENDALIDQLRRQNQHLKQMLAEHNLTVQKCLRKLEKTSQMERTEVQGEEWSSEAA